MFKKQQQKAGDSSQQFQAEQMTVVTGIDEKRAREIVDEKLGETIKNYSLESQKIAEERIQLFADDLQEKCSIFSATTKTPPTKESDFN